MIEGLTVVIIVPKCGDKSEFKRAKRSAGFADEVMVEEIREPVMDFAKVRNEVLSRAKNEWVLFLDADEEIGEELKKEMRRVTDIGGAYFSGFYFRRRDKFLGRWLGHGETAGVRLLRLARKDAGRWERPVHEVWGVGGRIGELKNPILHYSHESVDEMVGKLDKYSEIQAEYKLGKLGKFGKLGLLGEMVVFPAAKFIQNYFWRLGVLDGMEGFIHALMMSGHSLLVRAKILARIDV